jgi:hypothetical protein
MKVLTHHAHEGALGDSCIAFFILAALSLLVVYLADPFI